MAEAIFSADLIDLAARVQAEHHAATATMKRSFSHCINAGELLIEAKAELDHGLWLPWLQLSGVPGRTARRYMFFAKNRRHLEDENGHVANLTVRRALDLLTALPGKCRRRGDPGDLDQPFDFVQPFSVFDARTEAWQARKRAWLALGIQSELGRDGAVFRQPSINGLLRQRRGLVAALEADAVRRVA